MIATLNVTESSAKPAVEERRAATNRENAKRSTGPNTVEGKRRSRLNAVKHGLSGAGIEGPEDLREEAKRRAEAWKETFKAKTPWENWLLETAALATARMDACEESRFARLRNLAERAADSQVWDVDRLGENDELGLAFSERWVAVVAKMRRTSRGARWLLTRWEELLDALEANKTWNEEQGKLAVKLQGRPEMAVEADPLWQGRATIEDMRALASREILSLERGLEGLEDLDDLARIDVSTGRAFDHSKEGSQIRRYAASNERLLKWALNLFKEGRPPSDLASNPPPMRVTPFSPAPRSNDPEPLSTIPHSVSRLPESEDEKFKRLMAEYDESLRLRREAAGLLPVETIIDIALPITTPNSPAHEPQKQPALGKNDRDRDRDTARARRKRKRAQKQRINA